MYDSRYVAFIDILGFKNKTDNAAVDMAEFARIKSVLEFLEKWKNENYDDKYGLCKQGKEFNLFSDSIIISYPVYGGGNAFNILLDIAHICIEILHKGYIFRGGVTCGDLFHFRNVCFGPALNRAVKLENDACFPRIIIDQCVLDSGLMFPGIANSKESEKEYLDYLIQNDNGSFFLNDDFSGIILNYLALYNEFDSWEEYRNFIYGVRSLILSEYGKAFQIMDLCGRQKILNKYKWFANYFNSVVMKNFLDYEQYLIKL